jgi:outer membrane receptor protein involved in Fe transport
MKIETKTPGTWCALSRFLSMALLITLQLLVQQNLLFAGTTGKLAGRILSKTNEPLPSVNVLVLGTSLGAATDIDGYYTIINIPPGTYKIQISLVGYRQIHVDNIIISTNKTTKLNGQLEENSITQEEVVVTAEKPVIDISQTSSTVSLSAGDIQKLPVQEVQDVVNLQAGVIDGHFRGGRIGEVQYQVNGVSVNNAYDNTSTLQIDRSLIQEVQVISGTFDAEYGQAMSGVVNAVLKTGTQDVHWNAESFIGDYYYQGNSSRIMDYKLRPLALQNYQLSLSGPLPVPHTFFIVSGKHSITDSYFYGTRWVEPTDWRIGRATGDGSEVLMGYTHTLSGLAKITNRSLQNIEIGYQIIADKIDGKNVDFAYRYNPDGVPTQQTVSVVHGLDWTHTLSNSTFYTINLRQNYFKYHDYVYEDVYDPRYVEAGAPMSYAGDATGAIIQGVNDSRFMQYTNSYLLKGSITNQATQSQQFKAGIEAQWSTVEFGSPGYLVQTNVNGVQTLLPRVNNPPDYPDPKTYHPVSAAAYGQDQIEWNDLTLRAGIRADYFDSRGTIPSDLANPANSISGAPHSYDQRTTAKYSLSPRLGVSYPTTARSALFVAYGHFYQMPALSNVFANSDYTKLALLQAGGIDYGVFGNPDIKPERTVQYEFGYKNEITDYLGVDFSIFYKDIRDLLGVEFVDTYTAATYSRLTNVDFGSVYGFTIALDQRQFGPLSTTLDYTWQTAEGNSSDPQETATRASAGEDPRPRQIPLNWDQRHTLNFTAEVQQAGVYSVSTVVKFGSGQPYTPIVEANYSGGLDPNSGSKPSFVLIDLRAEKYFRFQGVNMSLFARVFNLLDTRCVNGFVFTDTGTPDYTRFPAKYIGTLVDPTRFYTPRRVEIGITLSSVE